MIAVHARPPLPTTPGEVHDLLQQMFGIGSYDEVTQNQTWWKARGAEVGKVAGIMRRRKVSAEDFGKAAWLARTQGIHVAAAIRLVPLVNEARREWDKADAAEVRERTLEQVTEIYHEAVEAGESEFAGRLLRADDAGVLALVDEWRSR